MKLPCLLLAASLSTAAALHAQVLAPGYTGFHRMTLPGSSDTLLATSFARPAAATGLVASVSGNRVTVKGAPGWAANQFVAGGAVPDSFYLRIASGPLEGATYWISANDANSVSVQLGSDSLASLAADARVSIVPYWTLASLFPGGEGIHAAASPGVRPTEVLFPDHNATGINTASTRAFYLLNGHWQEVGQGTTVRDHEPIAADSYVTVRHNVAASTEWMNSGQVVEGKLQTWLGVSAGGKRDNYLGLQRPAPTTLAQSGLVASGAFAASPSPGQRTDELLVFDNAVARQNKAASAVYYYWNSAWRKVGAGTQSFDTAPVFTPGLGFIIRKNTGATATAWTNAANY